MKNAVFIDGNWLMYKVFSTIGKTTFSPEKRVPLQVLNYACTYALERDARFGALAFDGSNNFRYKVYPAYKSRRGLGSKLSGMVPDQPLDEEKTDKDLVYECMVPTMRLFQLVRFPVFQFDEFEADDVVAAGAESFVSASEDNHSWITCRDKDSFQRVKGRVKVYWPSQGDEPSRLMDAKAVKEKTGFTPIQFGDFQILCGDATDDIPPVVTVKEAKKILKEHRYLKSFFNTKEGKAFFLKHETDLRRNALLIRMATNCWSPTMNDVRIDLVQNPKAFQEFGELPKSFHALRSLMGARKSLF